VPKELYLRDLRRCRACQRWWSTAPGEVNPTCPCGGELALADMPAHLKALPYKPEPPSK
jgi:hypothetical protein